MAEFVRSRTEGAVLEYDLLAQSGFFDAAQIKIIKQKREEFENKINGHQKSVEDIKMYIKNEWQFYRVFSARALGGGGGAGGGGIKDQKIHAIINGKILSRIKGLYDIALGNYPDNLEIQLGFFQFIHDSKYKYKDETICKTILNQHPTSEDVWIMAARWYTNNNKDLNFIIKLLLDGLKSAHTTERIYKELIQCEVKINAKNENENLNDILSVYINNIKKKQPSCEYVISLIVYLEDYPVTGPSQKLLLDYLLETYSNQADTHKCVALHFYKGYTNHSDLEGSKIEKCISQFEEGLKLVTLEEKTKLWNFFLNFLNESTDGDYNNERHRKTILKNIFSRASNECNLQFKSFTIWADLDLTEEEIKSLLDVIMKKEYDCVELCLLRMKLAIKNNDKKTVIELFDAASDALPEQKTILWQNMYMFHVMHSSNEEIEDFFQKAIALEEKELSETFICTYLEWLVIEGKIEKCREVFKQFKSQLTLKIYTAMLTIENSQILHNFNKMLELHELATEKFGDTHVEVWMNYAYMYAYYYKEADCYDKLLALFEKAKRKLITCFWTEFVDRYNKLRINLKDELENLEKAA